MSAAPRATRPRINIVWHKCTDLRLHDHEALALAHAEPLPVLHVFVLDPFWFKPLPLTGYPKTGAGTSQEPNPNPNSNPNPSSNPKP